MSFHIQSRNKVVSRFGYSHANNDGSAGVLAVLVLQVLLGMAILLLMFMFVCTNDILVTF